MKRKYFDCYFGFVLLLTALVSFSLSIIPDKNRENDKTYDFIVVGGGIGGCVVAARLAESGQYTVLLIEAGGIPHPDLDIPAIAGNFAGDPNHVKVIGTVRQKYAGLSRNGSMTYAYGQTLGGGSSVNGLLLNRGSPHDYDNWAKITGDESWNYTSMIKYFKKYEYYVGDYPSDHRGIGGPVTVSRPKYAPGLREWLNGGRELGFQVSEPNGPQTISFTAEDYTKRFGRRVSSYSAYIKPVLKPQSTNKENHRNHNWPGINLFIRLHSIANKIIFDGDRAVGVQFTVSNTSEVLYARATKEIIISSGAIGSPELLQKSGIGPKPLLRRAKIPLIKELPGVGSNFHDHALVYQTFIINDTSIIFNPARDLTKETFHQFITTGEGPYTSYSGNHAQAFLASTNEDKLLDWANVHVLVIQSPSNTLGLGFATQPLDPGELERGETTIGWESLLTRPKSRGRVKIDPKNINNPPRIDLGYFRHPKDLKDIVYSMSLMVNLCENTLTFQKVGCRLPRTPLKQCEHERYPSEAYWECFAKQLTNSGVHGGGSCRMGKRSDPYAVVDTELRVIGVSKLRVVDNSVVPNVINSNPMGSIYSIAEKAAEMILESWDWRRKGKGALSASFGFSPVNCTSCSWTY